MTIKGMIERGDEAFREADYSELTKRVSQQETEIDSLQRLNKRWKWAVALLTLVLLAAIIL